MKFLFYLAAKTKTKVGHVFLISCSTVTFLSVKYSTPKAQIAAGPCWWVASCKSLIPKQKCLLSHVPGAPCLFSALLGLCYIRDISHYLFRNIPFEIFESGGLYRIIQFYFSLLIIRKKPWAYRRILPAGYLTSTLEVRIYLEATRKRAIKQVKICPNFVRYKRFLHFILLSRLKVTNRYRTRRLEATVWTSNTTFSFHEHASGKPEREPGPNGNVHKNDAGG